jgi:hypothetical protein
MFKSKRPIQLFTIVVLASWQILLLTLNLKTPVDQSKFVWLREDKLVCISDFVRYYAAGQMARSPDSTRIYEVPVHFPYVNRLIEPYKIEHESAINFPPPAIAIMSLVSLLPLSSAYLVWSYAGLLFAFAALCIFLVNCRKFEILDAVIFSLAVFDSFTAFLNVRVGQWVFWLIGFYLLFFFVSLKKKEVLSGVLLGVLSIKPQYVIPVLLVTLIQRRWKALATSAITAGAMTVYAATLLGWHNILIYPTIATNLERMADVGVVGHVQASLRGFFTNLFPSDVAFNITSVVYWSALSLFALIVLRNKDLLNNRIMWVWASSALVAMIFSPHTLNYDMTLFCLPAALTLETLSLRIVLKQEPMALKIWHMIIFAYPIISWLMTILVPKPFTFFYAFINLALLAVATLYLHNNENEALNQKGFE